MSQGGQSKPHPTDMKDVDKYEAGRKPKHLVNHPEVNTE